MAIPRGASPAPRPYVDLRLLGGFAVAVDGAERPAGPWPSQRAMHLVALLALHERRRLPREQVIDALWPQLDPDAGAANLRKAAHHARHALGDTQAVVLQGGEVALWPLAQVAVDATVFEHRAREALARRDADACTGAARGYGGDLLPALPYEPWTEATRERLRSLHLDLLRAGGQWQRLAELDATDEAAHRALMARELAAGNRAAAIRWYARLRGALQQSLGVMPGRETEALYARCVAGLQRAGPALVGRAMARARIAAWLGTAAHQQPPAFVLRGPAGIGKSALLHELARGARERGWPVVDVDAAQPQRPYAAFAAVADRLILDDRRRLDAVGAPARSVLALLTPLAAPASTLAGPLGRHQVIGALRRLLLAAADGGEVLLQVDDAHLLDDADVDVLLHLIGAGPPLRVALATRDTPPAAALGRGLSRLAGGGAELVDLEPLPDDELQQLVAQAAPRALAAEVVARIVRLAEGNPFAAIELARSDPTSSAPRLPASAAEAISARLCDVPATTLAHLRWLALAGDDFDAATALALAPGDEAEACAALDEALERDVLRVADGRLRFRHDLVRQALIEPIAPHHRLRMHRDAAARLARLDAPPAVVARQWLAGGSVREAMPWSLAAARDAMRLAAFRDALRQLEPLLAVEPGHVEALRLRAEALDALGDPAAVPAYRQAADAAGEPLSHDLRAKGALAQIKQGDPQGALSALQGVRPTTVEGRLCEALTYSGAAALGAADPELGTLKSAEARRLALQSGDKAALVVASWAQAAAAHARGELRDSVWADLRETSHLPHLALRVFDGQLCILQRFLYGARPYPEVIAFAQALGDEAKRLGAARGQAFAVTIRGEAELLAGDLDAAEQHLREGARLHREIGGATGEAFSLQRLAEVAMHRGHLDQARATLDQALDLARQTDIGFHLLDRIYGTRMALAREPAAAWHALQEARDAVHGPLETCPGCRITFAVPAAIAAARAGRADLAGEYEQQTAYLADVVMRLPAWHAAHDEVRAHLALVRGEGAEVAAERFAAAARRFRDAGQPLDAARCERLAAAPPR